MRHWLNRILTAILVGASLLVPAVSAHAADGPNSSPRELVRAGDTMFFTADDGTHGWELWKSDGAPEGTSMVKDINAGGGDSALNGDESFAPARVGSTLYFVATDGIHGYKLWKSDGTPEGTEMVQETSG